MARGDQRATDAVSEQTGTNVHNWLTDTFAVALCLDVFADTAAFVNFSEFTQVTGGVYAAQPNLPTWTRSGSLSTLQAQDALWPLDASGPTAIRTAVLYNTTAGVVGNNDVITVVDVTTDGTTPISLQDGAVNVIFTIAATMEVNRN